MNFLCKLFFASLIILAGCSKSEITAPPVTDDGNLAGTTAIPFVGPASIKAMEGIYTLASGTENMGTSFVCKVSKYKVSFFSNVGGLHIILKYGFKASDGSIQFSGFWRYTESPNQGTIQFSMPAADGAAELLNGIATNAKLSGTFGGAAVSIQYERPFTAYAINNPIIIFAHHGIQTTVDPPFAENSLDVVLNAEDYGVTGLELDVRMTKDNVPILIHDPTINTRLTKKGPLFGYWDQYSFPFISQYVELVDGQRVPSVEQALNAFIDSTTMKYFWMDIKGNKDVFKYLEPIVRKAYERAAAKNRDVVLFAGLPSQQVIDELNKVPTYKAGNPDYPYFLPLPTLAEETVDKAIASNSEFFGPRYTLGLLLPDVQRAHDNGIKVISWTLNSQALISNYLKNGQFDGFITDYSAYVVYEFYTKF